MPLKAPKAVRATPRLSSSKVAQRAFVRRWSGSVLAVLAIGASLIGPFASEASAADSLPAFRVLTGAPQTPAGAFAIYGARDPGLAHTDGLCRDYSANAQICPGGSRPRAPEIVALADGLKHDPNLIYEYVRNSIETEFVFGSHKGALGAIINHSGTAFDQANLTVELLRQSGFAARYRFGDITLTSDQFFDWTGVRDAKAACRLLAAGAIPAVVNGAGNCELTGSVSSVVMAHVWVEADIDGQTYQFDPAFKAREFRTGVNWRAALVSGSGAALSAALQGAQSTNGGATVSSFNQTALATVLSNDAQALVTRLEASDLQGADLVTAIGGGVTKPAVRPVGGWRQTSLAYVTTARATWAEIPNVYRARIKLSRRLADNSLRLYGDFFTDEIFGRKLEIVSVVPTSDGRHPEVMLDMVPLMDDPEIFVHNGPPPAYLAYAFTVRLEFDHPFADSAYGDDALERGITGANPVHVLFAPGPVTTALGSKWATELAGDRAFFAIGCNTSDEGATSCSFPFGDNMRAGLAASYLAQSTQAATIHAAIADSVLQQQHAIGFLYSPQGLSVNDGAEAFAGGGEVADVVSAVSLTSRTSDDLARRAALHAIAATYSALEGSVAQQPSGSMDATSTARRFAWANAPGVDSRVSTPRPFKAYAAGSAGPAQSEFSVDGDTSASTSDAALYRSRLQNAINGYLQNGYDVVADTDAVSGPGPWAFENLYSNRGGSFIATKYAGADPVEIAHINLSFGNESKGGGLPNSTAEMAQATVSRLQDTFKDRSDAKGASVQSGLVSYESPELASAGSGEYPYKIAQKVALRGGGLAAWIRDPGSNLDSVSTAQALVADSDFDGPGIGNDGMAAMGGSRLAATAPTLAAFAAMQDIWKSAPSANREVTGVLTAEWWTWRLMENTYTIYQGAKTRSFVRTSGYTFKETNGGATYTVNAASEHKLVVGLFYANWLWYHLREWCQVTAVPAQSDLREADGTVYRDVAAGTQQSPTGCIRSNPGGYPKFIFPTGATVTRISGGRPENRYAALGWQNNLGVGFVNHMPYDPYELVDSPTPFIHRCYSRTSGVSPDPTTQPFVYEFKDDAARTYRLRFRAPVLRTPTQRPDDSCKLEAVYGPSDLNTPMLEYTYDGVNQVRQAKDALAIRTPAARGPYQFYIAGGYRGEHVDPAGGSYAVETLPAGGLSVNGTPAAKMTRHTDELGRVTTSLLDGRDRVLQRALPEGAAEPDKLRVQFKYDDRDHVVELRTVAKGGASSITAKATYDTIWNKPVWTQDANGAETTLSYYPAGSGGKTGQLYQVLQPTVAAGQPTSTFDYNDTGLMSKRTDPGGLVTEFTYDAKGNLLQALVDPTGEKIRTCFKYDAVGNVVGQTDPRAATCP